MKNKILLFASLLFGLMFINGGLNKFLHYMPAPENMPEKAMSLFTAMMQMEWLMPLLGAVEIVGGVLFIIPKYRALGAIIISPVMVGILLAHITAVPEGLPIALVLAAILLWVMFENREKYLPMVRK